MKSRNCARLRPKRQLHWPRPKGRSSAATEDLARARAERRRIDNEQVELEQRIARLETQGA